MKKFSSISATMLFLILMARLVTSSADEKPICTDLNDQRYPAISGDRIVWEDYRNGNPDIYLYDLSLVPYYASLLPIRTPISIDGLVKSHKQDGKEKRSRCKARKS
jgi:beta propeller repeat protein